MKLIIIVLIGLTMLGCSSTNVSIYQTADGVQHIESSGSGIIIKKNDIITVYTGEYSETEVIQILKRHFGIQK